MSAWWLLFRLCLGACITGNYWQCLSGSDDSAGTHSILELLHRGTTLTTSPPPLLYLSDAGRGKGAAWRWHLVHHATVKNLQRARCFLSGSPLKGEAVPRTLT